jgi:hypothetical protein
MLIDSRTDLGMCLVAVSVKPCCLRLSPTETNRADGVFLEKDELHPLWTEIEDFVLREVQRGCSSSFSRKTPSTRLVSVGDNLRQKSFTETATKHIPRSVRESTSIVYDAKWTIFSDWCVGREIDPFKISVQQLADFLVLIWRCAW